MKTTLAEIADEKLLDLCTRFGHTALEARGKFIGLLPEVNRRRLYEKRGCSSIFEFAAKLAGVSEEQVRRVLRLEKRFEDKPVLQSLLFDGKVSVNKLVRVASIATPENEEALAEKVRVLPRAALETLVRDERIHQHNRQGNSEGQDGFLKSLFEAKSVPVHTFQLSEEVLEKLNQLQEQGQDVNQILLELLEKRRQKIQEEKTAIVKDARLIAEEVGSTRTTRSAATPSRYIPMKIRRIIKEEFGKKCAIATCNRPSEEIHHTQRFSLGRDHNPHFLAPLCRGHHQLAHAVDAKVQAYWR